MTDLLIIQSLCLFLYNLLFLFFKYFGFYIFSTKSWDFLINDINLFIVIFWNLNLFFFLPFLLYDIYGAIFIQSIFLFFEVHLGLFSLARWDTRIISIFNIWIIWRTFILKIYSTWLFSFLLLLKLHFNIFLFWLARFLFFALIFFTRSFSEFYNFFLFILDFNLIFLYLIFFSIRLLP